MAHEVETMAFANEVPWHGLGARVDNCVTVDEMLVASGLDWGVRQIPTFCEIGGEKIAVDRSVLIRETDNKILTIASPEWKPLQNRDALEFFREYCEAGQATLETAGSLRGGKMIWGLASVKKSFTLAGRDRVKGYILLSSPHEVGRGISVRATTVRVVCANTLAIAERGDAHYSQSHLKAFDASKAKEMVAFTVDQIGQMKEVAEKLVSLRMTEFDSVRFLAKFFQPIEGKEIEGSVADQRIKALINEPSNQNRNLKDALWALEKAPGATPGNGWGVLNAVTYWADHKAGNAADTRLYKAWFGNRAKIKNDARNELLQMAA